MERARLPQLGDPDNLTDVQRVVMRDVHQDARERARPSGGHGRFDEARRRQRVHDALYRGARAFVDTEHVSGRSLSAGAELGIAVARVRSPADGVPEIELVRPGQMQHQIAGGVGLFMWTPPQIIVAQRIQTRANLARKLVEHPLPDHLQKLGVEGCVHGAQ